MATIYEKLKHNKINLDKGGEEVKDTINKRFKHLRDSLGISQEEFGKKIGLTRSGLSNIENGVRKVSDRHVLLVVSQYNVNETWLRTGDGEMFNTGPDEELAFMMGELFAEGDEFKTAFITEMLKLDDDIWAEIKNFINNLVEKQDMREER